MPLQRDTPHSQNQLGVTHQGMSGSANQAIFQPRALRGRETHCLRILIRSL
jgi:hypothetical protein